MTKILYGNEVALKIKEDLKLRIDKLKEKNIICLFDNDCNKWGTKIKGYKINAPNEITSIVDTKTAIVISSVSYQYEIAEDLIKRFNIKQENIFSYTSEYCEKNIYNIEKIKNSDFKNSLF